MRGSLRSVSVGSRKSPAGGEREGGEAWRNGRGRIEGEKKSESVSEAKKRKLELTGYTIGIPSMEEDLNCFNFFIVEQQKREDLLSQKTVWVHVV